MKAFTQGTDESGRFGRGLVHFPIADDENSAQAYPRDVGFNEE
jgi:hypothetical protein